MRLLHAFPFSYAPTLGPKARLPPPQRHSEGRPGPKADLWCTRGAPLMSAGGGVDGAWGVVLGLLNLRTRSEVDDVRVEDQLYTLSQPR